MHHSGDVADHDPTQSSVGVEIIDQSDSNPGCLRYLADYSGPCTCLSRLGVQTMGKHRRGIVTLLGSFVTLFCMVLNCIGCIGTTSNKNAIRDVYWAKYTEFDIAIYFNLKAVRIGSVSVDWSSMDDGSCKDASSRLQAFVLVATVMLMPVAYSCIVRGSLRDSGFHKGVSLLATLLQATMMFILVGDFGESCVQGTDGVSYGPGFVCCVLSSCLMAVMFGIFLLLPGVCKLAAELAAAKLEEEANQVVGIMILLCDTNASGEDFEQAARSVEEVIKKVEQRGDRMDEQATDAAAADDEVDAAKQALEEVLALDDPTTAAEAQQRLADAEAHRQAVVAAVAAKQKSEGLVEELKQLHQACYRAQAQAARDKVTQVGKSTISQM